MAEDEEEDEEAAVEAIIDQEATLVIHMELADAEEDLGLHYVSRPLVPRQQSSRRRSHYSYWSTSSGQHPL
ncbi:hypothetical protein M407DRAFT_32554 [Tulasnella calospora MUT 4182]|uniref:Uncharacterized protein n=1 Tax=Tulasnella calospora MUT 4182 TaxID=1051891 RepID=A0A0C3L8D6_9AGAM|nr:hypothetical protein M407DRAFT_32554 [Tulasnella calospora MUT 4182]